MTEIASIIYSAKMILFYTTQIWNLCKLSRLIVIFFNSQIDLSSIIYSFVFLMIDFKILFFVLSLRASFSCLTQIFQIYIQLSLNFIISLYTVQKTNVSSITRFAIISFQIIACHSKTLYRYLEI